jgi:hypothetical protein
MMRARKLLLAACLLTTGCAQTVRTPVDIRDTADARKVTMGAGVVSIIAAATAVGFTVAGASANSSIENGGLATASDISDAASRGQTYNQIAFISAGVSALTLGAALGLYFYSWPNEPSESKPK